MFFTGLRVFLHSAPIAEILIFPLLPRDKVRITDGLWAGKVGEVTGMDSRGQAKVLVGKMTVQVKAEDLIKMD